MGLCSRRIVSTSEYSSYVFISRERNTSEFQYYPVDSFPDESESEESASDSTVALDLTFLELCSPPPLPDLPLPAAFLPGVGVEAAAAAFFLSPLGVFAGAVAKQQKRYLNRYIKFSN